MAHDFSKDDKRSALNHAVRLADVEIQQTGMSVNAEQIIKNAKKFEEYLNESG